MPAARRMPSTQTASVMGLAFALDLRELHFHQNKGKADVSSMRKAAKCTQAELGRRLDRRQSYVAKVESGERRLDLVEFVWWTKALGLDPAMLVAGLAEAIEAQKRVRVRKQVP